MFSRERKLFCTSNQKECQNVTFFIDVESRKFFKKITPLLFRSTKFSDSSYGDFKKRFQITNWTSLNIKEDVRKTVEKLRGSDFRSIIFWFLWVVKWTNTKIPKQLKEVYSEVCTCMSLVMAGKWVKQFTERRTYFLLSVNFAEQQMTIRQYVIW